MKRNKIFSRIIVVTLLMTLLTFKVGRVVEVKAVGTTIAAAAGTALLAVGIVYCSYMALSGAAVHIPDTDQINDWLTDMGTKVVQFPAGRAAYEELYPQLIGIGDEPLISMLDRAWTWTSDKLKSWANDFSSVEVIENIATFTELVDVEQVPTNGWTYTFNLVSQGNSVYRNGDVYTFNQLIADNWIFGALPTGVKIVLNGTYNTKYSLVHTTSTDTVRNYMINENRFKNQHLVNGQWTDFAPTDWVYSAPCSRNGYYYNYGPFLTDLEMYEIQGSPKRISFSIEQSYPLFPDAVIYDSVNDRDLPMVVPSSEVIVRNPQYPTLPPEDDNKPVIPYLKLPYDPTWIDPITGTPGGGNWGFNLAQLLDTLEDFARSLMEIGALADLINAFQLNSGDEYYISYNEGDDYYYEYYTITNFSDDTYIFNIDVSEADKHLPVDLNTIQTYTKNRYLDTIKESAESGSSIIRDLVVFWYDVDPEIIYIFFGCSITVLIAAFIGKWGHS